MFAFGTTSLDFQTVFLNTDTVSAQLDYCGDELPLVWNGNFCLTYDRSSAFKQSDDYDSEILMEVCAFTNRILRIGTHFNLYLLIILIIFLR